MSRPSAIRPVDQADCNFYRPGMSVSWLRRPSAPPAWPSFRALRWSRPEISPHGGPRIQRPAVNLRPSACLPVPSQVVSPSSAAASRPGPSLSLANCVARASASRPVQPPPTPRAFPTADPPQTRRPPPGPTRQRQQSQGEPQSRPWSGCPATCTKQCLL